MHKQRSRTYETTLDCKPSVPIGTVLELMNLATGVGDLEEMTRREKIYRQFAKLVFQSFEAYRCGVVSQPERPLQDLRLLSNYLGTLPIDRESLEFLEMWLGEVNPSTLLRDRLPERKRKPGLVYREESKTRLINAIGVLIAGVQQDWITDCGELGTAFRVVLAEFADVHDLDHKEAIDKASEGLLAPDDSTQEVYDTLLAAIGRDKV